MSYLEYHRIRFEYLLRCVQRHAGSPDASILEVGRGPFTRILSERFTNVTTIGLELSVSDIAAQSGLTRPVPHIEFNLNDAQCRSKWISTGPFDLIVFAEVVEHLVTAPELVFAFLRTLLRDDGILICQTPNAVCAHNRIKMALGKNPFNRIQIDNREPAHFREYTKKELIEICLVAGLGAADHSFQNYFGYENPMTRVIDICTGFVPSLRRGQTLVLRKCDKAAALPPSST